MNWKNLVVTVGVVVVALVVFNALFISPQFAEQNTEARGLSVQRISNPVIMDQTLLVKGAQTINGAASVGGALAVSGAETVAGTFTANGASALVGQVTLTTNMIHSSASITPTDGGTLTPTAKLVTLTPAGAVGVALGSCTTGMETVLYNSVNANVVISDTGNGILAGNQTLGQFDALRLSCFATKWVQESAVSAN